VNPTPRAWLCDLDGTLYHTWPVRVALGLALLRASPAQRRAIAAFRAEHERQRSRGPGSALDPFERQLESTAARLGIARAQLEHWVRDMMIERPGPWLRRFRRRSLLLEIEAFRGAGGRTALVSDYPAQRKLAALAVEHLFEVVIASGEPGGPHQLKPDPEGYLRAAAALGVEPADCLVLGDRADADGGAARAAGMRFRRI
jgi:FMN phosphatase YigB (HAD superfamily)